jgi:hypothetical protein
VSAPTKEEAGPSRGPATHHSTAASPTIYRPPEPDKGFLVKAAAGKVRPLCREPEVSWYR